MESKTEIESTVEESKGVHQNAPKINLIDNGRTMVAGPGGIQGAGSLDMPGFFMSFSGVPGFNTGAV